MSACVAAYGVYLGLPLILGALASAYGFSNRQIGWIGSAENLGLLLGSIAVSALAGSGKFRRLVLAGIAIAISGNVVTLFIGSFLSLCSVRIVTGFGSGLCYSAAIACLSLTRRASRNFSVFIVVLVLANSLDLWVIPPIVSLGGVRGLYAVLGLLYLVPALLIKFMPPRIEAASRDAHRDTFSTRSSSFATLAWACLAAVVLFNVAASAFWAYAERIGAAIGMAETAIANTLTLCNLFSLTGSVLAYWLSRRWGQHRPQLAAIAVMIAVYAVWAAGISTHGYVLGVLLFFEVWSMASVYQLGTLTEIDRSGRYVALIPAAQGIGQSAGPFFAGLLLGWNLDFAQMLSAVDLFAAGCFATYAAVYLRLRRIDPAAAIA